MENIEEKSYIVVINTNQYAGNFEREITAFITGQIGECGVGDEQAKLCPENVSTQFAEIIYNEMDDNGCSRPCTVWEYGKRYADKLQQQVPKYNGVAIFFHTKPSDNQINIIKDRAKRFNRRDLKIEGFRLIEKTITYKEIENGL